MKITTFLKATTLSLALLGAYPHVTHAQDQQAAAAFPAFCQDWNRQLHDREVNNLRHLTWHRHHGMRSATYTGYGAVDKCEYKGLRSGTPIGDITYSEKSYALSGRTIKKARSAGAQLVKTTPTLEIFSWENDRWFY